MKICAIICEYNPLHNGHLYQIREAKRLSGADAILCIMSGNFVQRGEDALLDKYTRAKHALFAGADAVIELPTVFATSNAELFAKGAIWVLNAIPDVQTLCFGCETDDKELFIAAAQHLNNEPTEISEKIKNFVSTGMSYAKARALAWSDFIPTELLCSPNNILGLEYTRAILSLNSPIKILPIKRIGNAYNDKNLQEQFSSATAIREAISNGQDVTNAVPDFVAKNLVKKQNISLDTLEKYAILSKSANEIAKVCDCSEGLENALKKAAESTLPLAETLTSARYTTSRIRRIALQNLLTIHETVIRSALQSELYLRILAVKKDNEEILRALGASHFPTIARAHDENKLSPIGKKCYNIDKFAEKIYSLSHGSIEKKNIFY